MQYRKKPVVIEAIRVSEVCKYAIMSRAAEHLPEWINNAYFSEKLFFQHDYVIISTLEGEMRGNLEDWIIQGINGELYPCKPDIFDATYEQVE